MLGREFGWTPDEMRQLYPSELKVILKELRRQIMLDGYAEQRNRWAFLAAVITNGFAVLASVFSSKKRKPKLVEADDFLNKDYKKTIQQVIGLQKADKNFDKHIQDAKQKGLKGPW
ncbi:MAG TPA: hypothetical protein GXX36_03370 [Clostridiaceae bacterium]|nr:hypothetical protein [Clostridiaceae bacterium]